MRTWGLRIGKCSSKSLNESESIVRAALCGAGTFARDLAMAPAHGSGGNWAFLHVNGDRRVDPVTEDLIRALQARYDLAW